MTTMFMIGSAAVGAVVALLAWLTERALRTEGKPVRWVWVAALLLTVAVPFLPRLPLPALPGTDAQPAPTLVETGADRLGDLAALLPATSAGAVADGVLSAVWLLLTLLAAGVTIVATVRLVAARRRWPEAEVLDTRVRLSRRFGPAVVGLFRPTIVLPRRALDLHADEMALVLEHEREHLRARDPWLLAFATLLVVALPWNLPLVWQALRLRRAVELDCDARVLARGAGRRTYASLLVRLASDAPPFPFAAAALAERRSFLRDRIEGMRERVQPMAGYTRLALVVAIAAGLVGIFAFAPRFVTIQFGPRHDRVHELRFKEVPTRIEIGTTLDDPILHFDERRLREEVERARREAERARGRIERVRRVELREAQAQMEGLRREMVEARRSMRAQVEPLGEISEAAATDGKRLRDELAVVAQQARTRRERAERELVAARQLQAEIEERLEKAEKALADGDAQGGGSGESAAKGWFLSWSPDSPRSPDPRAIDVQSADAPLIFVDGERLESPDAIKDIAPERIDRVEVIKGEAAAKLWGEEAANGVVQIFLKPS